MSEPLAAATALIATSDCVTTPSSRLVFIDSAEKFSRPSDNVPEERPVWVRARERWNWPDCSRPTRGRPILASERGVRAT